MYTQRARLLATVLGIVGIHGCDGDPTTGPVDSIDGGSSADAETVPDAAAGDAGPPAEPGMILWGGYGGLELPGGDYLDDGKLYRVDSWNAPTNLSGGARTPVPRYSHTAVWTGRVMIVWGGKEDDFDFDGIIKLNDGATYDPVADEWALPAGLSGPGAPSARLTHTAVWTGDRMIVWGGWDDSGVVSSGAIYDVAADSWKTPAGLGGAGALSERNNHCAVWTGETGDPTTANRMIVWGGWDGKTLHADGAVYDPATDSWSAPPGLSGVDAPDARAYHRCVWTGSRMIVWGGNSGLEGTGKVYDFAGDRWTAPPALNEPPLPLRYHSAVWTGDNMIVWGGFNETQRQDVGFLYQPDSDTWTTETNLHGGEGAPVPRYGHTAVWIRQ